MPNSQNQHYQLYYRTDIQVINIDLMLCLQSSVQNILNHTETILSGHQAAFCKGPLVAWALDYTKDKINASSLLIEVCQLQGPLYPATFAHLTWESRG